MTRCGFPIPGADILTYITAEHPGSHRLMKLIRYLLFELDSEIGDAAAAIHLIRLMNRIRRAGIDAACTAPAVIRHRRDRKSTRLNSSHVASSYAVFCLKNTTMAAVN